MIRIGVALPAEARPLIAHYRLKRRSDRDLFRVFVGDDVQLVVSGPGKVNAAAAVAYLHASAGERSDPAGWLNVGVAGHPARMLGEAVRVHSIVDPESDRRWYPPLVAALPWPTDALITVERPETHYPQQALYDMEGAGFFSMAARCVTSELVQLVKVVSDNRQSPTHHVTAHGVEEHIAVNLPIIHQAVELLQALAGDLAQIEGEDPQLDEFLKRWRFTVSQRHRLNELLRRHAALAPRQAVHWEQFKFLRHAREVLSALESRIKGLPVSLVGS